MNHYNQFLCVIGLTLMVGCTDCSDMVGDDVTASTPMGVCGDVTQALVDDVPAPTVPLIPTNICDNDDLDSEYIVWYGDVTIEDLESFKIYTLIKGDIDLSNAAASLERVDLPELQVICGSVRLFQNDNLVHINLSQLQTVHGDFFVEGNGTLQNINVLKLQTVAGAFTLDHSNPALRSIDLPSLKTIGGFGQIRYHEGATSLNLPRLQSVGDWFAIVSNNFTCIDLSQLQTVGSGERVESVFERGVFIQIGLHFFDNNSSPEHLVLPQLQSVEGDVGFEWNSGINIISMPQLQSIGHNLEFRHAFSSTVDLSTIDMPQLQTVGGIFRFDSSFNPTECNLGSYTDAQCP